MKKTSEDYSWQKLSFEKWDKNGRKGVIKAVPGAGKTRAAINIIKEVEKENPDSFIIVVCPTNALIKQWKAQVEKYNVKVMSYFNAAKLYTANVDLVILDECHSVMSRVRGRVLNINYKWVLGLSATPGESTEYLGGIVLEVDWENSKTAEFELKYKTFKMEQEQRKEYYKLTRGVRWASAALAKEEITMDYYMTIIMKRRSFVYNLPQRAELTLELLEEHKDKRIMVFCERLSQIDDISDVLRSKGIKHSIYTSKRDTLKRYLNHETNILISSRMIKEGFDDPSTNMGIVVSTPLSKRNHIQTIGRIVRYQSGKIANIICLLAEETTDISLIPDEQII